MAASSPTDAANLRTSVGEAVQDGAEFLEKALGVVEIGLGELQFRPPVDDERTCTGDVSSPLILVGTVVVSLIFERQFEVRVAEVESAEELSRRRVHVSVHLGFGQAREHDRNTQQ
jgi:hypothetical protein